MIKKIISSDSFYILKKKKKKLFRSVRFDQSAARSILNFLDKRPRMIWFRQPNSAFIFGQIRMYLSSPNILKSELGEDCEVEKLTTFLRETNILHAWYLYTNFILSKHNIYALIFDITFIVSWFYSWETFIDIF